MSAKFHRQGIGSKASVAAALSAFSPIEVHPLRRKKVSRAARPESALPQRQFRCSREHFCVNCSQQPQVHHAQFRCACRCRWAMAEFSELALRRQTSYVGYTLWTVSLRRRAVSRAFIAESCRHSPHRCFPAPVRSSQAATRRRALLSLTRSATASLHVEWM